MARVAFTASRVGDFRCPPDKAQAFLWDAAAPGLGLRATPNGKPAYVFQGAFQGKDIRITIGGPEAWSIKQAQQKARELQRQIDEGRDPREVKRVAVSEHVAREAAKVADVLTVGDVWPLYLEQGRPKRKAAWKPRYKADLVGMAQAGGEPKKRGAGITRKGPLYPLMADALKDLNEDRIQQWFNDEAKSGPHQAARALMMFRGFLRWCASKKEYRGLVDRGAANAPAIVDSLPQVRPRTDSLGAAQVRAWFDGVAALTNRTAAAYLQVLLLTGARREEIAALTWAKVDRRWKKIALADKVHDGRVIPLSAHVAAVLETLPRKNEFVFASESKSGRITDARASHVKVLQHAEIEALTFHGLRRSFSLLGEAAGAPAGAIAQIMGHAPSATAEGYRPRTLDGLRPYLALVESHILGLAGIEASQTEARALRVVK